MEINTKFEIGDIFWAYRKYQRNVIHDREKASKQYSKRVERIDLEDLETRNEIYDEYSYTNGFDIYVRQVTGVRIDDYSKIKYIDDSRAEWEEDVMFHNVGDLIKFMEQTLLTEEKHTKELLEKFL